MCPSFIFTKRAPISASTAEAATIFIILHRVNIAPFRRMVWLFLDNHPRKKCPYAWLRAPASERYDDRVDIWDHVGCTELYCRVRMGGKVVKKLFTSLTVFPVALDCSDAMVDNAVRESMPPTMLWTRVTPS